MGTEATEQTPEERAEKERDQQQAMVLLYTWGSTTYPPEHWNGYGYAETNYCPDGFLPDGVSRSDEDRCVTVLHHGFGEPHEVPGYRVAGQYQCGEPECPACEATGLVWHDDRAEHGPESCEVCGGDKRIYWGEEWSLVVYVQIDPNETLAKMRKIAADHDNVGALYGGAQAGAELARLFRDLDAYLSDGGQLPEAWDL